MRGPPAGPISMRYCKGKDLAAEADQAWYEAARQGSGDQAVNQKLGLTDSYQGVAVSPAQKQFLDGLKPRLRVINHDPTLQGDVVVVNGQDPTPIPPGQMVELTPPAGALTLGIARPDRTDRPLEEFYLTSEPGVVQTVEIYPPQAAPGVPFQAMRDIYTALQGNPAAEAAPTPTPGPARGAVRGPGAAAMRQPALNVDIKRDRENRVTSASAGSVHVLSSGGEPVSMQLTTRQDQLLVSAIIPQGNRFKPSGLQLMSGSRLHSLALAMPPDGTSPLRLTAGAYCVVRAELADGLWDVLAAINGDLAYERARSAIEGRVSDVALENERMEADGKLFGPWQTRQRIYDAADALDRQLQRSMADQSDAYALPLYRDRARALGLAEATGSVSLNWSRFRRALALALEGAGPALEQRLAVTAQARSARSGRAGAEPSVPTTTAEMIAAAAAARSAAPEDVNPDAAPFDPPDVAMDERTHTYAMVRLLPLMSDDAALRRVKAEWTGLDEQQRIGALMALELAGTPQAVDWLGQLAQNATDTDVTAMALLSLGAIGTPEALAQTQVPGVSAKVHAASLVASVVAGDADAIQQVPAFLSTATADESAAFLQYVTQFDTPGTLLALSQAMGAYSDPESQGRIAAALARMGGQAATRELSRLMEKSNAIFASDLASVRGEDALLLVRQVGSAVAGQQKPNGDALRLLAADGSPASIAYMLASAINQGDAEVLPALCKMGTADALEAAQRLAGKVTLPMLSTLRKQWLTDAPGGAGSKWTAGVDGGAARTFLEKLFAGAPDPKVRVAAATMLSQVGRALPPDQLLAFAASAPPTAGSAGPGAPSGFEWPSGEPLLSQDFTFDEAPGLYAVGLALQAKDPALAGALQGFLGSTSSGPLKAAAMVALGRLGGDDNLKFLRAAAAQTKDSYADTGELGKVLQDRLAALQGLGAARDAAFLPRVLDMLQEAPPAQGAVAGAQDYDELADWWQITLWRGAADCVAGICSQRSPLELTADSGLQSMLTERLKALIDEPGPKRDSLSDARQELRGAVIRAFGRVADFNDADNSFVLSRLVIDLSQEAGPAARGARTPARPARGARAPAARGGASAALPTAAQPDLLRVAVLDAVAHAGARAQDPADFVDYARTLTTSPKLQDAWDASLLQMAGEPTGGYFALLAAGMGTLNAPARTNLFEATRNAEGAGGPQYGTFLADLLTASAAPAGTRLAARTPAPAARSTGAARNTGAGAAPSPQPAPGLPPGMTPEAFRERMVGAATAAAASRSRGGPGGRRGGGPGGAVSSGRASGPASTLVVGYDRRLPYKLTTWDYKPPQANNLRTEWSIVERLIAGSGQGLAAVVRRSNLMNRADVGPAVAPALVEQNGSARGDVVTQLGELLAPKAPEPTATRGRSSATQASAASADARRAAVAALRSIGGQDSTDALYTGLVGPTVSTTQTVATPVARPGGVPMPPRGLLALQAAARTKVDPIAILIARALGSMGEQDLLVRALTATDREFFAADAVAVQSAVLNGMAYLPASSDPVSLLVDWGRRATAEPLRQAVATALVTAARLSELGG